jgi:hypothetical protein
MQGVLGNCDRKRRNGTHRSRLDCEMERTGVNQITAAKAMILQAGVYEVKQ